jgi:hypothetical protein
MDSFEANTHVFIIRVWREQRDNEMATPEWRGVIEHVPTGQRRYFKDPALIVEFIGPYLQQTGIRVSLSRRLRRCVKRIVP